MHQQSEFLEFTYVLQGIRAVGNKILDMQKAVLDNEIRNILWGMVKCLMYKPGMVEIFQFE